MKKQQGFTLIELMITVAIVAILASIAYPSYDQHVKKGRRENAKAELLGFVQNLERQYAIGYTYVGNLGDFNIPTQIPAPPSAAHYSVSITNQTKTSYTLTITPTGVQTGDKCGALSVNHAGVKTAATTGCW